ncbi:MAG: polysaccharide biosynthesis tyrosine autokinase, partial [Candidatus Aminicenantes bacterium]
KKKNKDAEMSSAISGFLGKLQVENIKDSRLVKVRYRSTDPGLAANVVNTLFKNYIDFNRRTKTESTKLASEFLTTQIDDLRNTLYQKAAELQDYGKQKELYYLSDKETTVMDKLAELNKAFASAQVYRINKEAIYRELKGKNFENYPEVRTNPLIQDLKKQHSSVEVEYNRKAKIFKESYPEMQRLKSQLGSLQQRIDRETREIGRKILKEAEAEYQSAKKKEDSLANLLDQQKQDVVAANNSAINYTSLKIEVENMQNLLDHLVKKQKESLLTSRLEEHQTSNITVVDLAEVPTAPISPNKKKTLIMALFLGICGGLGLIFLLDWLDKTIKTPDEVETLLKVPSLGFIPALDPNKPHWDYAYSYYSRDFPKNKNPGSEKKIKEIELANYLDPESIYAENYRNIRTSILLSTPDHQPRILTITSAIPQEGKTAAVVNLAVSFTEFDKKVLIIDADLRNPGVHKIFKIKNTKGLSSFLVGRSKLDEVIFKTEVNNLTVIPSGPVPPNPGGLLYAKAMGELVQASKADFDFIFLDTPPLMGITDAVIIGHHSDGVLLITWGGKTHKKLVEKARDELNKYTNLRLLGVVLNRVNIKRNGYRYYSYNNRMDTNTGIKIKKKKKILKVPKTA